MRTRLFLAALPLTAALVLAGCDTSGGGQPEETGTAASVSTAANGALLMQPVNNEAALARINQEIAGLPPQEQLDYLADWYCASWQATVGARSAEAPQPLLQRATILAQRYDQIAADAGLDGGYEPHTNALCGDILPKGG